MGKFEGQTIEILNWEKFNPRPDRKTSTWFRMDHSIFEDPKFDDLSAEEVTALLYILCMASKVSRGTIDIKYSHAERIAKIKKSVLDSALKKLQQSQFITIAGDNRGQVVTDGRGDNELLRQKVPYVRTYERNDTYERTDGESAPALPPLAELWNDFSECLPKVKSVSSGRKRQTEVRWREKPDSTYWCQVIERIARSGFCNGKNDRGWVADFDFLIKPDTHARVLEGKYDDRAATTQDGQSKAPAIDHARLEALRKEMGLDEPLR